MTMATKSSRALRQLLRCTATFDGTSADRKRALLRNLKDNLPYLVEKMPEMPGVIYRSLKA